MLCDLPEAPQVGQCVTGFLSPPPGSGSVLAPQVMAEARLELLSQNVARAQVCGRVEAEGRPRAWTVSTTVSQPSYQVVSPPMATPFFFPLISPPSLLPSFTSLFYFLSAQCF